MDRGNNIIGTKIAQAKGGSIPDPRILKDKVVSYIGIGGSDWTTRIQCDHGMQALTPAWKVIDNERFSWSKNIILEPEKVDRVREIGVNLANAAKDIENAIYMGEIGVCSHCHCKNFYLEPDSTHAICCLCGIEGVIEIVDGKVKFVFPEEQLSHAHDTISGKLIHADDIKNNEEQNMAARKTEEYKEKVNNYKALITPTPPPSKR